MTASEQILQYVQRAREQARLAEADYDALAREIEWDSKRSIDLFGGSASRQVADIAAKSRRACESLYTSYQMLVKTLDENCRPLLAQGPSGEAIKAVADLMAWLNSESEIENNFTASFNSTSLGDVANVRFFPTMENQMLQRYWEQKYRDSPEFLAAEEAKRKAAEEAAARRKAEEPQIRAYRAWESERDKVLQNRERLVRQRTEEANAKLNLKAQEFSREYDAAYGETIRRKQELEKTISGLQPKVTALENQSPKGSNIIVGWGVFQAALGLLCISLEAVGIGVVNLIFGGLILYLGVHLKASRSKNIKKLSAELEAARGELQALPPVKTRAEFAADSNGRFSAALAEGTPRISDAEEAAIRRQVESENPIPEEPPRPSSLGSFRSGYSSQSQARMEELKEAIVEGLNDYGSMTVSDLIERVPALEGETNQYVSAVCRALVLSGRIEKFTQQRRTYFRIP